MPGRSTGKTYHHGDLRNALLAAAERLMAEQAGWTFGLREIARAAGVSHNAPYNHFADRRGLLAAVAARGFRELTAALRRELATLDPADTGADVRATGRAYVNFAVAHPARYRLMFSAELAGCTDAEFVAAGQQAFAVLDDLVARGIVAGRLRPDGQRTHALAAWSLVHGLSTLVLDGRVPPPATEAALAALADQIALTLVGGLAVPSARA